MDYDHDKVDEMVMALLYLTIWEEAAWGARAWKSHDWDVSFPHRSLSVFSPSARVEESNCPTTARRSAEEAQRPGDHARTSHLQSMFDTGRIRSMGPVSLLKVKISGRDVGVN